MDIKASRFVEVKKGTNHIDTPATCYQRQNSGPEAVYIAASARSQTAVVQSLANYFIQVEFFWAVTPCSVAVGYQRFGRPCCIHLQGEPRISYCTG
jgi:hypothetical protein